MNSVTEPLDYVSISKRPVSWCGPTSFALCILQLPWVFGAAWAYWVIIWGDNQPPMSGVVLSYLGAALPCLVAVLLGLLAIWRPVAHIDRIMGVLGLVGGLIWTAIFCSNFINEIGL